MMPSPSPKPDARFFRVTAPMLYPIAAAAGDFLLWHPENGLTVSRMRGITMLLVRTSPDASTQALRSAMENGSLSEWKGTE